MSSWGVVGGRGMIWEGCSLVVPICGTVEYVPKREELYFCGVVGGGGVGYGGWSCCLGW